jgi:membrane protein YqaA with SNARE-associated domain
MLLWLLLAADFVVQEPITSSALLLSAYQQHYNLWLVSLLFVAATAFDSCVGYWIGSFVLKRYSHTRFSKWLAKRADTFSALAGTYGKRAALLFWAPSFFPYSTIVAPWFGFSFTENLVLSVIGDTVIWYGSEWLVVLGVKTFVLDPFWDLVIVMGIVFLVVLIYRYFSSRAARKE